jgi:hypothetical protein
MVRGLDNKTRYDVRVLLLDINGDRNMENETAVLKNFSCIKQQGIDFNNFLLLSLDGKLGFKPLIM